MFMYFLFDLYTNQPNTNSSLTLGRLGKHPGPLRGLNPRRRGPVRHRHQRLKIQRRNPGLTRQNIIRCAQASGNLAKK